MARKRKAKESPAKDGPCFVTYVGDKPAVFSGRTFVRDVPVPMTPAEASRYRAPYFEVSYGDVLAG